MGFGDVGQMKIELEEDNEIFEKDIYCPYCFCEQEITDVKEAYEDGTENSIRCESCGKHFEFDTHVDICYYIRKIKVK